MGIMPHPAFPITINEYNEELAKCLIQIIDRVKLLYYLSF